MLCPAGCNCTASLPLDLPCSSRRAPQLPLGASLPAFLLCFHAVNLPFCVLNAARLAARGRAGKGDDSPGKRFAALLSAKTAGKAGGKAGGKAAARAQKAAWE